MTRFRSVSVAAIFLLLFMFAVAACNNGGQTPSPTNTPTPGQTPSPTAEPSPTPVPVTLEEVLAETRSTLAEVGSLRFSFSLAGPTRKLQGTGAWAAGDYSIAVESEACPPAMEGVPDPDECAYVPTYEAVGVGERVFSHNGSGDWETADRQDNGWALGPWSNNFDVQQFNLPLNEGPSSMADAVLERIAAMQNVEVVEELLDGTAVYQVSALDGDTAYELFIERETHRVLRAVLTMHPENPTAWTWDFSDYDETISIEQPN